MSNDSIAKETDVAGSPASLCSLPFVTPVPHTGPVTVIREKIATGHDDVKIHQHGGSFRLVRYGDAGFKVTISADDALWIIDNRMMGASTQGPFRRSVVWSNE